MNVFSFSTSIRAWLKRAVLAIMWPPVPRRYLSARKIFNYYLAELSWRLGLEWTWARPFRLTLELTNICNLRCPQALHQWRPYLTNVSILGHLPNRFRTLTESCALVATRILDAEKLVTVRWNQLEALR